MQKNWLLLCAAFAVLSLAAGPKADADREKIASHFDRSRATGNWTWVFYGDSITHGAVHTKGWRCFVEIFQERVRTELGRPMDAVINSGNSGQSSVQLVNEKQYDWQVRRFKPNVVLILIGCNDIVRANAGGVEDFRARLEKLVKMVRADGAIPVLQTYNTIQLVENPTTEYLKGYVKRYEEFPAYNQAIRDTAEKLDVILVDHRKHWEKNASKPEVLDFWLGETIHPGGRGHQEMAVEILKALGMYSPSSKCCSLEAGGPAPEVSDDATDALAATFDQVSEWKIDYSAENGLPPASLWKSGYPAGRLSIVERDGKKALLADHSGITSALISIANGSVLEDFSGIMLVDMEIAFPDSPPGSVPHQFFFGVSAGDAKMAQAVIMVANGVCGGSFSCTFPKVPWGKFFTIRIALDMDTKAGTIWLDGKRISKSAVAPLSPKSRNFLYFGDGGKSVDGKFELRRLRVTSVAK